MRSSVFLVVTLLATASLAGCFGAKETSEDLDPNQKKQQEEQPIPEPVLVRALTGLGVAASVDWVAPGTPVQFNVTPPTDAVGEVTYAWFYGLAPGATAGGHGGHGGHAHADTSAIPLKGMSPGGHGEHDENETGEAEAHGGHEHAEGGFDTGNLAAGESAEQAFDKAGIYRYHCHPHPWMKGNVTVSDTAEVGTYHVTIVDGDGTNLSEYRYYPENLEVGVGSTVVFHNNGTMPHTATQEAYEPPLLPIEGASGLAAELTFPEAGKHRVVVVATDEDNGTATAVVNVLVDPNVPDSVYENTFEGSFRVTGFGNEQLNSANVAGGKQEFGFKLEYDGDFTGTFAVAASSPSPSPPTIRVKLLATSGEVVSEAEGESGELPPVKLYAGIYKVVVEGLSGGSSTFTVDVKVDLDLVAPHDHGGGHGGGHQH